MHPGRELRAGRRLQRAAHQAAPAPASTWAEWPEEERGLCPASHLESCPNLALSKALMHKERCFSYGRPYVLHSRITPSAVHYELILSMNLVIICDQCDYRAPCLLRSVYLFSGQIPGHGSANLSGHFIFF